MDCILTKQLVEYVGNILWKMLQHNVPRSHCLSKFLHMLIQERCTHRFHTTDKHLSLYLIIISMLVVKVKQIFILLQTKARIIWCSWLNVFVSMRDESKGIWSLKHPYQNGNSWLFHLGWLNGHLGLMTPHYLLPQEYIGMPWPLWFQVLFSGSFFTYLWPQSVCLLLKTNFWG